MDIPRQLKFLASITPESSESDIAHKVVLPLLHTLGYRDGDWRSQAKIGANRADFLVHPPSLLMHHAPYLVIEVKAPSKKLSQNIWQISGYMRHSRAVLGLLTNGYGFHLLYHYQGQVITISEYTQSSLIENFSLVHNLLGKTTCMKVRNVIYQSLRKNSLKICKLDFKFI